MAVKLNKVIAEMTSSISLCCYNTINTMCPLFDHMDKDGNVRIPAYAYCGLIDLLANNSDSTPPEKFRESLYARSQYRRLLLDLKAHAPSVIGDKATFMVGDTEVGIIANGKIMGGTMNRLKNWYETVPVSDMMELVDHSDPTVKNTIYLHPDRFMNQPIKPSRVLTPYEMYLYCKAGDALISTWTHLMLHKGCSRGNYLLIEDDNQRGVYEFRLELHDEESSYDNTILNANHYELHPRMRFNEYYLQ